MALSDLVEERDYLDAYGVKEYLPRCIAKLEELVGALVSKVLQGPVITRQGQLVESPFLFQGQEYPIVVISWKQYSFPRILVFVISVYHIKLERLLSCLLYFETGTTRHDAHRRFRPTGR